jgi:hypothetical protein
MRLTVLFLLVFGWGSGTAEAETGLEGADAKPALSQTIGAESSLSKIGLGRTDWGIPSPQLTQFTSDLATAGDDLMNFFADKGEKGLKAWEVALDGGLVDMRVKTDFLETVSHYTRTNNPVVRAFSNNMSLAEEAMIRHYTTGAHNALNTAIKRGVNLSDDLLEFKNTLNTALYKLPDHVGIVHRGLDESTSIAAELWTVGQKIQRPAFVSSSTSESVAETFMNIRGGNVTLRIESQTGKLIQDAL